MTNPTPTDEIAALRRELYELDKLRGLDSGGEKHLMDLVRETIHERLRELGEKV